MRLCALLLSLPLALLPLAGVAAGDDEPEAVYAKFHRAVLTGNVEEMLRQGTEAQRVQMAPMSEEQKKAQLKAIGALMPPKYELRAKKVAPDGQSAQLWLSGPGKAPAGGKPETLYATVFLVMQRAEWKVAAAGWSSRDPGLPPNVSETGRDPGPYVPTNTTSPAAAAVQKQRPVSQSPATQPVGSLNSAPERKFGQQKPPCEFKPVMTAEDLENCR
jgi:hypothetical protein